MAFNTSNYVNGQTVKSLWSGSGMDLHGTTGGPPYTDCDTVKVALFSNAITNGADTAETYGTYSANEVSGTGYTAGGKALNYPKVIIDTGNNRVHFLSSSSGSLGSQETTQWTSATFGPAYGALVYDDTQGDYVLSSHYFGDVSGKTVSSGTFTITWDATYGIYYATY
jgi:hypothetical protein